MIASSMQSVTYVSLKFHPGGVDMLLIHEVQAMPDACYPGNYWDSSYRELHPLVTSGDSWCEAKV